YAAWFIPSDLTGGECPVVLSETLMPKCPVVLSETLMPKVGLGCGSDSDSGEEDGAELTAKDVSNNKWFASTAYYIGGKPAHNTACEWMNTHLTETFWRRGTADPGQNLYVCGGKTAEGDVIGLYAAGVFT
ncbi:hypothetical protein KIPB_009757, partial [Kipferlia bialata]